MGERRGKIHALLVARASGDVYVWVVVARADRRTELTKICATVCTLLFGAPACGGQSAAKRAPDERHPSGESESQSEPSEQSANDDGAEAPATRENLCKD